MKVTKEQIGELFLKSKDEDKLKEALSSLENNSIFVKLLGSYQKAKQELWAKH